VLLVDDEPRLRGRPIAGQLGLNHFGLASMRQQLEMAGGSWQVRSRPGNGTTVTATLPLTLG
jgi:signal transduction histidine kinase